MEEELTLMSKAIIGNLLNAASDVLDPWNIQLRPRCQYMHKFRDQRIKLLKVLSQWNPGYGPELEGYFQILGTLRDVFKDSPKITQENCPEISKNILIALDQYGYKPTRAL